MASKSSIATSIVASHPQTLIPPTLDAQISLNEAILSHGPQNQSSSSKSSKPPRSKDQTSLRAQTAHRAYGRGPKIPLRSIRDKKLRTQLQALEARHTTAEQRAHDAEILLEQRAGLLEAESPLERTYKVRQDEIRAAVPVTAAANGSFALALDPRLGPYDVDYTRNGRSLLVAGRKGHVAAMEWRAGKLSCELQLGETVRTARWLHNDQYFAVAQKKYVYIYDRAGVELHCLKKHIEVTGMEFLPYHFLLATVGNAGHLRYQDTSTGALVADLATKLGPTTALAQNPQNAILHLGHHNGTITLWSPNRSKPHVKLLAHRGPVRAVAIDRTGRHMVSTGHDGRLAVWDVRMYRELANHALYGSPASLAISDTGFVAVGWNTSVTVWKDLFVSADSATLPKSDAAVVPSRAPYLSWGGEGRCIERVRFCPFEDVLAISHDAGINSALVPGAGEPNLDALELNPFESVRQRQEAEVKALLGKLQPEMIALDASFVGRLDGRSEAERRRDRDDDEKDGGNGGDGGGNKGNVVDALKDRARGRNSALRKYLRKKGARNVIDERRVQAEELRKKMAGGQKEREAREKKQEELGPALARFATKGATK